MRSQQSDDDIVASHTHIKFRLEGHHVPATSSHVLDSIAQKKRPQEGSPGAVPGKPKEPASGSGPPLRLNVESYCCADGHPRRHDGRGIPLAPDPHLYKGMRDRQAEAEIIAKFNRLMVAWTMLFSDG
jgi:hypothetical protein